MSAAKRMAKQKQMALLADPGDGKTITALTALSLMKPKPKRTLVLAPAKVCQEQVWPEEIANWKHMYKAPVVTLQGLSPKKRKAVIDKGSQRFYIASYALIPWLLSNTDFINFFDAVVFDELSNMKDPGSIRFRRLRNKIVKIPIRFGLTGSPVGNSMLNLWSEMYCVAGEEPLGRTYSRFRDEYFEPLDFNKYNWGLADGSEEAITKAIKPYAIYTMRTREENRVALKRIRCSLPANLQPMYDELEAEFTAELESGESIYSPNAAVLSAKLKQVESGAIYKNIQFGEEPSGEWVKLHNHRIEATKDLFSSLEGQQLLVFYEYKHELTRLLKAFPEGVSIKESKAVKRWNNREIPIMFAHPASAGHGINLHLGGAYNILFFSSPWSLELTEQAIGRLDRKGQKRRVNVYQFSGTKITDKIRSRVKKHRRNQDRFKEAIAQ